MTEDDEEEDEELLFEVGDAKDGFVEILISNSALALAGLLVTLSTAIV